MRKLIFILLFAPLFGSAQRMLVNSRQKPVTTSALDSMTVNFSASANSVAGSNYNMVGDPSYNVLTYNHSNGWSISTVATGNWVRYTSSPFNCSINGLGNSHAYAPIANVPSSTGNGAFFNYSSSAGYNSAKPHFQITGLNPSEFYTVSISGSRGSNGFDANPMVYTISGATTNSASFDQNQATSAASGYTVSLQPNGSGVISCYVNVTVGASIVAFVSVIKIKKS